MVPGIMQEPVPVVVVNVVRVVTPVQGHLAVALVQTDRFQEKAHLSVKPVAVVNTPRTIRAVRPVQTANMLTVPILGVRRVQLATTVQAV